MLSIESSLRPLIVWMRILGFHSGSSGYSVCLVSTSIAMLLSTIALHCTSFAAGVVRLRSNDSNSMTTANLINKGIEHLNFTIVHVAVHSAFFLVTISRSWIVLWNTLEMIQQRLDFKTKFYIKCRKSLKIGFFLLFLDCVTYFFMSMQSSYWNLGGSLRPLAVVLSNISRTAVLSVFLLFCVVSRVTTLVFQGLNERVASLASHLLLPLYSSTRIFNTRLEKWRRDHLMACQLVDMVNHSFGFVLLVTITNGFVSFITTSFEIVRSMQDNDTLPVVFAFIFIKKSILLTILIYEPYRLQAEAARTASLLRRLQPSADLFTQIKMNAVVMEVTHACPKITAMEFFDVNLRLLPTLIGSTLTYVAILCQASSTSASHAE